MNREWSVKNKENNVAIVDRKEGDKIMTSVIINPEEELLDRATNVYWLSKEETDELVTIQTPEIQEEYKNRPKRNE